MRHLLPVWLLLCLLVTGFSLSSCQQKKPQPPSRVWTEYVAGHTGGWVSRSTTVRVQFAQDIISPQQVGQSAATALKLEPAIAGKLIFSGAREITLTPDAPLPRGQEYRATLIAQGLQNVPAGLTPYEFRFGVMPAQFEVTAAGLEVATGIGDGDGLLLRGTLETADREEPTQVEQLLSARFQDKPLMLSWSHFNEGRSHHFTASGITRQAEMAQITLSWNGKPLGLEVTGERVLEVPQRGVFKVLDAVAQGAGKQAVIVRFSDLLDANQNLKGLITLGSLKVTAQVDGNSLRIYPERGATGTLGLKIAAALRNAQGGTLGEEFQTSLEFANEKPQVRFAGKGVILPDSDALTIPIEGMNVDSVQVTAFQVYGDNMGQFLQVNNLSESSDIQRVGRYLWRRTIPLKNPQPNQWTRYALDATELLRKHPGALFRLSLSINRGNAFTTCPDGTAPASPEEPYRNQEDPYFEQSSGWDGIEDYYEEAGNGPNWADRENPCTDAYYRWGEGVRDERNFLASNIGLIAKRGERGALLVTATRLSDAQPLVAEIEVHNFQNQRIATGKTGSDGMARIEPEGVPFYLIARSGSQTGYLKLNRGVALPMSHFDTGGETVSGGIKGFLYGERGVWRPGDTLYLTFMLEDRDQRIPDGHPVTLQLLDPANKLVRTVTNTQPVGDFYRFDLTTDENAPTGTWTAQVQVGGAQFRKPLKIETVMPNRLKMELEFAKKILSEDAMPLQTTLRSQWLHGAVASGLKADVAARMVSVPTRFTRAADYVFDDPARQYRGEPETLFQGSLDDQGVAQFGMSLKPAASPPGMLEAQFTTRVFEQGGAFSTGRSEFPYHPYTQYVGMRLPKGDASRNMLLTDKKHPVEIAVLDTDGKPAKQDRVQLSVYKIEWRWWWEQGQDNPAQFSQSESTTALYSETVELKQGRGTGHFEIKYPDWGRYLLRACDPEGGHCTGQIVYADWPGWAGRAQDQSGPAASVLSFTSDKPQYRVGETAVLQLPDAIQGRALLSLENGSRVLEQRWVELTPGKTRIDVPLTAAMSPNVYASLTLIQPHAGKDNDRPIRLYGVIPLAVQDPATRLEPVIQADKLWQPERKVTVGVSEKTGRAMTYTVAVVDEGLLGLTNYKTPDAHSHFYKREALGVFTWDLFDEVAGAYGAELERLLALGGDEGRVNPERQEEKRFPPVVQVLGPFQLAAGKSASHTLELPQYVGEVRVMVVAGAQGAYGMAQQPVTVRTPLALIPTLPRVLGPGETVALPVAVFAYEPGLRDVRLALDLDPAAFEVLEAPASVSFDKPGDRLARFVLKARERIGLSPITVRAEDGGHKAAARINLPVRAQNPAVATVLRQELAAGEAWQPSIPAHGIAGTTSATLEVSRIAPLNLDRRLQYLVQYPHGCLEQTTSSVFPQLYLDGLMQLSDGERTRIQGNVNAGIDRLRQFQPGNQGFSYWPGAAEFNAWSNNYAGHFLVEARRLGYVVPAAMFDSWVGFQRTAATAWVPGGIDSADNQAYRLLTLALAGQAEVGAMNRLREQKNLSALARWQLAAAYAESGMTDAARDLLRVPAQAARYDSPGETFGSDLRDQAVLLTALMAAGDRDGAGRIAQQLSEKLATDSWYSTQSTAYALMAMARFAGRQTGSTGFSYRYARGTAKPLAVESAKSLSSQPLSALKAGSKLAVTNTSSEKLFASLILRGSPVAGGEKASRDGLTLDVSYSAPDGSPLDVAQLRQGQDFVASVQVSNIGNTVVNDLALTHVMAAGWEIHNPRFTSGAEEKPAELDYQDIRDDRVLSYFKLKPGESRRIRVLLNASYEGAYYLPAVSVESMYDARRHARSEGRWVRVVR